MESTYSLIFGKQVWPRAAVLLMVASVHLLQAVSAGSEWDSWEFGPTVLSPSESERGLKAFFEATATAFQSATVPTVPNTAPPSELLQSSRGNLNEQPSDVIHAANTKELPTSYASTAQPMQPSVISLELLPTSQINFSDSTSSQLWQTTVNQFYSGRTENDGTYHPPSSLTLGTSVSEMLGTEQRPRANKKENNVPLGKNLI